MKVIVSCSSVSNQPHRRETVWHLNQTKGQKIQSQAHCPTGLTSPDESCSVPADVTLSIDWLISLSAKISPTFCDQCFSQKTEIWRAGPVCITSKWIHRLAQDFVERLIMSDQKDRWLSVRANWLKEECRWVSDRLGQFEWIICKVDKSSLMWCLEK